MKLTLSDTRLDGRNAWVAEIMGTDPKFVFARRFLRTERRAKTITVGLDPGKIYEVNCPDQEERYFVEPRRGQLRRLSHGSVREHFVDLEESLAFERKTPALAATFGDDGGRVWDDIRDL